MTDYIYRNNKLNGSLSIAMKNESKKLLQREVLLAFWKVHILHHADEAPLIGQWMLNELRSHGYEVSPGTLYPMLRRMEAAGWLASFSRPDGGARAPREYRLTEEGREVLDEIRDALHELANEVGVASQQRKQRKKHACSLS
jgi:PadR family transcriptional regulator, regulatory protein PadR